MFGRPDSKSEHDANMGNTFPTALEPDDPELNKYITVYDYLICFIGFVVVVVNLSVVISSGLLIKKGVEPRYAYLFLGNVAVTDMITGISTLFGQLYPKTKRNHALCALQMGMIVSCTISSVYSVGLLAIDRFLYIVYGIKYCKWISVRRVRGGIILTWIMAITIGFLPLMGWSGDSADGKICWFITVAPHALILLTVTIGIVPVILVIVLYSIILYHAIVNINKIQYSVYTVQSISEQVESLEKLRMFKGKTELPMKKATADRKGSQNYVPHKWKAIKVVLFTTFAFLLAWCPYFVACVIYVSRRCDFQRPSDACKTLELLIASPFALLGFTNSLMNPLIYAWWHTGFRSYVKRRMKTCWRFVTRDTSYSN